MADEDPLKLPFGALNNISEAIGGSRQKVSPDTDWLEIVTSAGMNSLIPNTLLGTGPYKAIVLRVETDSSSPEAGSWLSATYDAIFGTPPQLVKIKARIPEIHAALPIPEQTGDAPGPHQPIIDLYPTFIAQDTQVEAPKPGDIVNVDFGNKNTWDDPIYLGPLLKTAAGPGALGGVGGAGIFGNCGASIPVSPTPAAQPAASETVGGAIEDGKVQPPEPYVYTRAPEYISGFPTPYKVTANKIEYSNPDAFQIEIELYKKYKDKDPSTWDLGSVYIFGDSQTNGMEGPITNYFSGFNVKYNNWYGGAYRMAYKDVPKDKVKSKNEGKSIESYFSGIPGQDFKMGDTIIIGSIGGNASFNAREKFPKIGEFISEYWRNQVELDTVELPTLEGEFGFPVSIENIAQSAGGSGAASSIASKYGLGRLIQDDPDHGESFKKFCQILNEIKSKGVNIKIFGLPLGGVEAREDDRIHFDYVQFASLAAEGLGKNYVSVEYQSRELTAGTDDVHYFTGNGGSGYDAYFQTLVKPHLDSFYYEYKLAIENAIEGGEFNSPEASQKRDEEFIKKLEESGYFDSALSDETSDEFLSPLQFLEQNPPPEPTPPPPPTSPAPPPQSCIGTVGGSGGGAAGGGGGGGATGGKSFGVDPNPFNGGQTGSIVINGQSYPVDFPVVGSQQFKGQVRKGNPTYVVIHNSAGPNGQDKVWNSLLSDGYGVHFTVGLDGVVYQHADPVTQIVYHASGMNTDSIGIETPMKFFGPVSKTQGNAGFTLRSEGVWWSPTSARKGFTEPPQIMVDAMNRLLATLAAKIPSITPFLSTFPNNYPGPEKLKKRTGEFGVKMWNRNGAWNYPVPSIPSGPYIGSIVGHRDWSAKVDGRYFLEKFYEYYTGNKLDGIFRN